MYFDNAFIETFASVAVNYLKYKQDECNKLI